jgi:hypothetical protein
MLDCEGIWDRNDGLLGWNALLASVAAGWTCRRTQHQPETEPRSLPAAAHFRRHRLGRAVSGRGADLRSAVVTVGVSVDRRMWGGGFRGSDLVTPDANVTPASLSTLTSSSGGPLKTRSGSVSHATSCSVLNRFECTTHPFTRTGPSQPFPRSLATGDKRPGCPRVSVRFPGSSRSTSGSRSCIAVRRGTPLRPSTSDSRQAP